METVDTIYNILKSNCNGRPVGVFMYITFDGITYECGNSVCLSFRENDISETLKSIQETINRKYYYSFFHLEKGRKFVSENKKALCEALSTVVLRNAGFGSKVCKN